MHVYIIPWPVHFFTSCSTHTAIPATHRQSTQSCSFLFAVYAFFSLSCIFIFFFVSCDYFTFCLLFLPYCIYRIMLACTEFSFYVVFCVSAFVSLFVSISCSSVPRPLISSHFQPQRSLPSKYFVRKKSSSQSKWNNRNPFDTHIHTHTNKCMPSMNM